MSAWKELQVAKTDAERRSSEIDLMYEHRHDNDVEELFCEEDEEDVAKNIGNEILENIEFAKTISTFESGVEQGLNIASGFVRKVCGLDNEE